MKNQSKYLVVLGGFHIFATEIDFLLKGFIPIHTSLDGGNLIKKT
jgi:hypothetical protein